MSQPKPLRLRFDSFELDEVDARLRRDGEPVAVPPRAFAVLCTLARQAGQLVTKDALLDAVWGHRHVSESVLKTTISELRAALDDDARQPRYIETAARRGYRFIGTAGRIESAASIAWRQAADGPAGAESAHAQPGAGGVSFIGRERALAQLRDAWAKAQMGQRQLVWVAGEAGVGKTRLIDSFIAELPPGTATFGQCVEDFGTGEPYLPILEAMRELCRRDPALVEAMRAAAPTWLVQMPWLVTEADRATLYTDVSGAHQDRMVREMRELMDRFTARRPLVFVLEDLHWSDAGTLRMMEHFARRPREVRILWIASFRLTQVIAENHPLRALRQELRLHKLCREILLEPFSQTEVASYLAQRLPAISVADTFVRRVHAHTDGLPLFVANVADTLLAQTQSNPEALRVLTRITSDVPLPVPDSLAGVIEKQIERLPEETQGLLEAASVLGMDFRASLVAALLERDIDWVCDEFDLLVRRQFWVRLGGIEELADGGIDPRYAFLHALYKHVFYQRISLPQRVQLHRRASKALEAARDAGALIPAAELASHAARGNQYVPALRYYAEAADYAVGHFAPTEALELTAAGIKLLGRVADGAERAELELGLVHRRGVAAAQLLGVGSAEAISAFERTRELCDALPPNPLRALLMSGLGLTRYVCGDYKSAEELAQRALSVGDRFDNNVLRVSAALLLGMVQAARGEHRAARATLLSGIAACERIEQIPPGIFVVDPLAALHSNIAVPQFALGFCDQARRHLDTAHARAQKVGQPTAQMLALWGDGMVNVRAFEPIKVIECATVLGRIVAKNMLTQGNGPALWLRGWALAQAGKTREGHRLIREGYDIYAKLGMFAGNSETLGYAVETLILAEDWVHAERQLEEATKLAERLGEHHMYPWLLGLRARIALQSGRDRAHSLYREALDLSRRQHSPFHEIRTLTALCDHGLAAHNERGALRHAYETFPEGRELPFMQKAKRHLR